MMQLLTQGWQTRAMPRGYLAGADAAVVSEHHAYGGRGAVELAKAVKAACQKPADFSFLYPLDQPIKAKIEVRRGFNVNDEQQVHHCLSTALHLLLVRGDLEPAAVGALKLWIPRHGLHPDRARF